MHSLEYLRDHTGGYLAEGESSPHANTPLTSKAQCLQRRNTNTPLTSKAK